MTAATQIEAGPECRRAVAEALGLRWIDDIKDYPHLGRTGAYLPDRPLTDYNWVPASWDTDWNCAMWAAERVGLFRQWELGQEDNWYITIGVSAPTGPLCVCRAILALKEGT